MIDTTFGISGNLLQRRSLGTYRLCEDGLCKELVHMAAEVIIGFGPVVQHVRGMQRCR